MNEKHIADLLYWVAERERIRHKHDANLARPWTTDPILHSYRFCNVERERDTVTRWIHNSWIEPNADDPSVIPAMIVARMVNLPETLEDLGYPLQGWTPQYMRHFIDTIEGRRERGEKSWTSAYMITGGYSKGGEPKEVIIARVIDGAMRGLETNPILIGDTLAEAALKIKSPGIGTFLTAQIIADLKWTEYLSNTTDWWTWCAPGPGSTAGLNYLHDRDPLKAIPDRQFLNEVHEVQSILKDAKVYLDAQNTQNCLCEVSKYIRTKYYGGRPKAVYTPAKPDRLG